MVHPLSGHFNYKNADFADIFSRAEDGDLEAIAIGANIIFQGFGLREVDTVLARTWLEQGAAIEETLDNGERLCTVMLGLMQAGSIGMIGQEDKGREKLLKNRQWLTARANEGHAGALRILSFMHGRGGLGVERSVDKAIELLKLAAEKNDPFALYDLGTLYMGEARESDRDYLEAARYFKKAALMGHSDAQRELGIVITNALSTDISVSARIADVELKHPEHLAEYEDLQNAKFAMDMLHQSAAQGRISAMYSLGRAYSGAAAFNNAVPRDVAKAVEWHKKAVDKGYPRSFIELAKLYETWFKDTGSNHPEHNKATALNIYYHLLGRPRKPGDTITVSTQPLTPEQITDVKRARRALEEEAIKDTKTWYRYANGDRRITFDDGTSITFGPNNGFDNPEKNVAADIQQAQDHETGNGHALSYNEAYSIYRDILARKEGGEYAMPSQAQIKQIKALMTALEDRADETITQPDGKRTLIYKMGGKNPDQVVFAGPKEVPEWKAKKAAERAAKAAERQAREAGQPADTPATSPTRPADTSQTGKKKKKGKDKKNER